MPRGITQSLPSAFALRGQDPASQMSSRTPTARRGTRCPPAAILSMRILSPAGLGDVRVRRAVWIAQERNVSTEDQWPKVTGGGAKSARALPPQAASS
jgi:hypothetical protein